MAASKDYTNGSSHNYINDGYRHIRAVYTPFVEGGEMDGDADDATTLFSGAGVAYPVGQDDSDEGLHGLVGVGSVTHLPPVWQTNPDDSPDAYPEVQAVVERFFRWFVSLPDHTQQALLKDSFTHWMFVRFCKNRIVAFNEKYRSKKRRKKPAHVRSSFTLEELKEVIREYHNPLHLATMLWQLYTFCRVSETNTITRYGKDAVRVETRKTASKGQASKILPLHGILPDILCSLSYVQERSKAYIKKLFVQNLRKLGEDFNPMYGRSEPTKKHPDGRPLYQFSSHSIRHTGTDWAGERRVDPYYIAMFRGDDAKKLIGTQAIYRSYKLPIAKQYLEQTFAELNEWLRSEGYVEAIQEACA